MLKESSSYIESDHAINKSRLYYLDWLRISGILLVFFIHCAKIYDYHTNVVVNEVRSPILSILRDSILLWVMPMFFVISGASVFFSIKPGSSWIFIKSRFIRLFIPLIFAGTFIINPIYVYIERLSAGITTDSFFHWYPQYFDGIYGFGGNFASLGNGTYLWYLEFLFLYSLILLPLFLPSIKRNTSILSRLSHRFEKLWALFLLFLPISAAAATFEIFGLGGIRIMGGWDPLSYLFFFIYGYLIFSCEKITEQIKKYYQLFLSSAVILTLLLTGTHFGFLVKIPGLTSHDLHNSGALLSLNQSLWITVQALRGLVAWCWIIGLLGIGRRFLNFNHPFLIRANEAVLPFYILHYSIIYIFAFLVIQREIPVYAGFSIVAGFSFITVIILYELVVRRIYIFRFLFGMKRKR